MLDLDKVDASMIGLQTIDLSTDYDDVAARVVSLLPAEWQDVSYVYQLSSSQGLKSKDTISLHLFFLLNADVSNEDLKTYFGYFNGLAEVRHGVSKLVDMSLFNAIQAHYTAGPVCVNCTDPLAGKRIKVIKKTLERVRWTDTWIAEDHTKTARFLTHLGRVGDDKDGFNDPLASAACSFVIEFGDTPKAREEFKSEARSYIDAAKKGNRDADIINRYTSDTYLEDLLTTASSKGFKGTAVTDEMRRFFEEWFFVGSQDKYFNCESRIFYSKESFDVRCQAALQTKGLRDIFAQEYPHHVVDNVAVLPNEAPMTTVFHDGQSYYNYWPGRTVEPSLKKLKRLPILEKHILYLCDGDQKAADELVKWLAHTIRYPGVKVAWAPMLISDYEGVGKSIFQVLFRGISSPRMIKSVEGWELSGSQFNDYAYGGEICFINEISAVSAAATQKFNSLITEDYVYINEKGIRRFPVPNTMNYFLSSNSRKPMILKTMSRRLLVVTCSAPPKPQKYYRALGDFFENNGDEILTWAESVDLSNFDRHEAPIVTDALKDIVNASQENWKLLLRNAMQTHEWPFHNSLFTLENLVHVITERTNDYSINVQSVGPFVTELGAKKIKRVRFSDSKQRWVWIRAEKDQDRYDNAFGSFLAEQCRPIISHRDYISDQKFTIIENPDQEAQENSEDLEF
jgi:hypothetical protein